MISNGQKLPGSSQSFCFFFFAQHPSHSFSTAMLGKRARPSDEGKEPEQKLRRNVSELLTGGSLPAARVQSLLDDIAALQRPEDFQELSTAGSSDTSGANTARNLLKKLKSKAWPPPYFFDVTAVDKVTNEEVPNKGGLPTRQHTPTKCLTMWGLPIPQLHGSGSQNFFQGQRF